MTDAEIIKALECCSSSPAKCGDCPCLQLCDCLAVEKDALDLINRQKAEIERLKNEIFKWSVQCDAIGDCMNEAVAGARAEAIKEFAERLKNASGSAVAVQDGRELYETKSYTINAMKLDNLVKEMVGDTE